ncbi:MAG: RNA polymerase sigma factor, partial [Limisphaerales bacterium]
MSDDSELLNRFVDSHDEDAFAELVRRHLNLVYSAALRQTNGDTHLAQDVAQTVFTELARKAASLARHPNLAGWLYTSTHFAAANTVRTHRRRFVREQESYLMRELLDKTSPDFEWEKLRPVLDAAMHELKEQDRDAILLRFFENQPMANIGNKLGVSEDTARKRVERALEKLRDLLAHHGITTADGALSLALSANAIQVAPAGLATILIGASLAGGAATTTTATLFKLLSMTTLQKTLIATVVVAAVGTGFYESRQASQSREQVERLQLQQAPLLKQVQQLQRERDEATNQLAEAYQASDRLSAGKIPS